jgi:hypothetical protein
MVRADRAYGEFGLYCALCDDGVGETEVPSSELGRTLMRNLEDFLFLMDVCGRKVGKGIGFRVGDSCVSGWSEIGTTCKTSGI